MGKYGAGHKLNAYTHTHKHSSKTSYQRVLPKCDATVSIRCSVSQNGKDFFLWPSVEDYNRFLTSFSYGKYWLFRMNLKKFKFSSKMKVFFAISVFSMN